MKRIRICKALLQPRASQPMCWAYRSPAGDRLLTPGSWLWESPSVHPCVPMTLCFLWGPWYDRARKAWPDLVLWARRWVCGCQEMNILVLKTKTTVKSLYLVYWHQKFLSFYLICWQQKYLTFVSTTKTQSNWSDLCLCCYRFELKMWKIIL